MNKEQLGSFIGDCRRELGLTQRELAERVHVTNKAVSKWECGLSYPDVTLLEPLAAALELRVEELMACRRQDAHDGEEESMKNLLVISDESIRRERRKIWGYLGAVLALMVVIAALIGYNALYVTQTREDYFVLKETVDGVRYVYVKEGDHLLKLRCADTVDFDRTVAGEEAVYLLECRWNRLTYTGTVTSCTPTNMLAIGSMMDQVGSAMELDRNPETGDALFGYDTVTYEYRAVSPNPTGDGFFQTYDFWRGTEEIWDAERLLTVQDCLTFAAVDWDSDGVTELLVRTRWLEKPYTVYDRVDGAITASWPNTLPAEYVQLLRTPAERQETQNSAPEEEPDDSRHSPL